MYIHISILVKFYEFFALCYDIMYSYLIQIICEPVYLTYRCNTVITTPGQSGPGSASPSDAVSCHTLDIVKWQQSTSVDWMKSSVWNSNSYQLWHQLVVKGWSVQGPKYFSNNYKNTCWCIPRFLIWNIYQSRILSFD